MNDTEKIDAILSRLRAWADTLTPQTATGIAWDYAQLVDDITAIIVREG